MKKNERGAAMVTGIICEFNPFHKGHQYLLRRAREHGAETVVCAMSGNFVQRGDFAVADKFARAEMAVRCGADLVLELPTPWAMAGAETFAKGGVELLIKAGCDVLAFGSECGNLAALQAVAEGVAAPDFMDAVRAELSRGVTFAAARQAALQKRIGDKAALLEHPNNTLAVEYLKAIAAQRVDITPYTISRIGAAHDGEAAGEYASATYLRELLKGGKIKEACGFLPPAAAEVLRRESESGRLVYINNGETAILAYLRRGQEEEFAPFDGGGEGLYHRLYDAVRNSATWEELLFRAKTKRYPLARLRRMALSAYLELRSTPAEIPYLRVLAANGQGRAHLRKLQDEGAPVLTKAADVAALGGAAEQLFRAEARRTDLYVLARQTPGEPDTEWRTTPLML